MPRRRARAHPVPNGETNLQIQFHGENAPALPAARKGKSGRLLLRRQRDYPAATVADFCTAVLSLAYYERCSRILADLEEADVAVSRLQAQPRGTLKVNAPMSFGTLHLTPALIAFAELYPELRVNLVLNDRFVDMLDEGFDVGIRIGKLEDSTLIVRRIAPARRVVCAAPAYLARQGTPAHPGELAGHACLHYGYLASGTTWKLSGADGEHSVAVEAGICVNNGEMLRDLAVAGLGIALLPTFIVGPALADGTLRSLLDDYRAPETAINVIYPREPPPLREGAGVHRLPRRAHRDDALLGPAGQLSVLQKDDPDRRQGRASVEFRNRGMRKAPLPRTEQRVAFFLSSHPLPGPSAKHGEPGRIRGSL